MSTEGLEARIKELEARLAAAEHRNAELHRAITHMPCGVEVYDRAGTATYLNPAMVQLTDLPSAEVAVGRFNILSDPFSIETGLKPLYERAYAGELVHTDEFVIEMKRASDRWGTGPRQVWFKLILVPTFTPRGEVDSVVAIAVETTETRRVEKTLERLAHRDGIELLAGGVAHDFNNLLTAIMMNGELVRETSDDDFVTGLNEDILLASQQAVFLTRQLLEFTREGSETVTTVDLSELTQSIARAFRNTLLKVGQLKLELEPGARLAEVNPGQYKQVFMNLLTNAMEALPEHGGIVRVRLSEADLDDDDLSAFSFATPPSPGRWHVLAVTDNGCGMEEDTLARIFEPFFTTKATGSGLGLVSTMGIVQRHGGGVAIQSTAGQGSCFRVCIPLSKRTMALAVDRSRPIELPATAHILVADNAPELRGSLRALLERMSFTVTETANGEDALALIESEGSSFDLLVLDIMMPVLTGTDVLRTLRGRASQLPVLLMSTHREIGEEAVEGDRRSAFIEKPFSPSHVLEKLAALLASTG